MPSELILISFQFISQLHTYVFIAPPPDSERDSEAAAELETKLDSNPDLSKLYGDESPGDKQTDHGSGSGGQGENLSCEWHLLLAVLFTIF